MRRVLVQTPFSHLALLVVASLVGVTGGCRHDGISLEEPTSPEPAIGADVSPPARDLYPLALGNSWTFDRRYTVEIEIVVGPPYHWVETYEGSVEYRITGREEISGVEYLVEQATLTVPDRPETVRTWEGLRQDHAGFYGADVPVIEQPSGTIPARRSGGSLPEPVPAIARKAWRQHIGRLDAIRLSLGPGVTDPPSPSGRRGGVLPGEIQYLAYPLHPKATWFNRTEPFFVRSEVEAHEVLDLPAGRFPVYRLRVENPYLDDEDRVLVWYGRCGRVAFAIHTETWAMDVETGEVALITTDETERLRELSLVDPSGCVKDRTGGGR